jgi:5-methylcytosine-specific restriction endonuclease McrA
MYDQYADTPESEPKIYSRPNPRTAAVRALRDSDEFRKLRAEYRFRAQHHRNPDGTIGEPCWLCFEPILYNLKYPDYRSWSCDHAIPIKDNPALTLNPSNLRSAHLDCNRRRGSDAPQIDLGTPSEIW